MFVPFDYQIFFSYLIPYETKALRVLMGPVAWSSVGL